MQAEGIKNGDRHDEYDGRGRVFGGWTATGDAVVEGNSVFIPIRRHDGRETTLVKTLGEQVELSFGVGGPAKLDCTCREDVRTCILHRR